MRDVQRVVVVDVPVRVKGEVTEEVLLQGYRGFHYEGIEIEPPEPGDLKISMTLDQRAMVVVRTTILRKDTSQCNSVLRRLSPSFLSIRGYTVFWCSCR